MKKLLIFLLSLISLTTFSQTSVVNGLQVKGMAGAPSGSTPGSNSGIVIGSSTGALTKNSLLSVIGSRIRSITSPNDSTLVIGTDSAIFSIKVRGGLTLSRQGWLDSARGGLALDSIVFRNKGAGKTIAYVSVTRDSLFTKNLKDGAVVWTTNTDSSLTGSLSSTGVSFGTYGDATHTVQVQVGLDGRIIQISNVAVSGGGGGGGGTAAKKTANPLTGNYTLVQADSTTYITVNSGIQDTVKIPDDATASIIAPVNIEVYQLGGGKIFVQPLNGLVSVAGKFGRNRSAGQYSKLILNKIAPNNWIITGDLDTTTNAFLASSLGYLPNLTTVSGTPSTVDTFSVVGGGLSANATVTAPTNFEVSLDNSSFASIKTITQSGGTLASQPVRVYARVAATAAVGTPSGYIVVASSPANLINVAISGTVTSNGTGHYRQITIAHSKVPNTDQTNFPMLFSGTYPYLKSVGNGGSVQNGSGFDITFSTDNGGSSLLNWEIESWDPTTGAIVAWVKIPTLSHTADGTIYLRYGSASISTFQGGSVGSVWDANFIRIWHMNQTLTGSGQSITEYTTNNKPMTSVGTWVTGQQAAGQIGGALTILNASGDYLTFGTTTLNSTYTLEAWVNTPNTPDNNTFVYTNSGAFQYSNFLNQFFQVQGSGTADADVVTTPAATWTSVAMTRTGTTDIFYHNGTGQTALTNGQNYTFNALGNVNGVAFTNDIKCDELRISNIVRSADWLTTTYNTESSPSTFYSIGSEN